MRYRWMAYLIIFVILLLVLPIVEAGLDEYIEYEVARGPECVNPVDFDSDGDIDLVMLCNGDMEKSACCIQYLINDGSGNFMASSEKKQNKPLLLDCNDMDGDSDIDIVLLDDSSINILHNDGNGNLTNNWSEDMSVLLYNSLDTLDLDGDDQNDIAFFDSVNLHLFLSDHVNEHEYSEINLNQASKIHWIDVDNDGDYDIFSTYSGTKLFDKVIDPPRIDVYKNDGRGEFALYFNLTPEFRPGYVEIDKIHNGNIAMISQDLDTNNINIHYLIGQNIQYVDNISFDGEYDSIDDMKIFDINNDNKEDLLVLRSINVIDKVIRIYRDVISSERTKKDISVSSETTEFCVFKADKNFEWDVAGWEGSELLSAGETVWVLNQKEGTTNKNGDNVGNGDSDGKGDSDSGDTDEGSNTIDILLSPIFIIIIVVIVVIIIITIVFFRSRVKNKKEPIQPSVQPQKSQTPVPITSTTSTGNAPEPTPTQSAQPAQHTPPTQHTPPAHSQSVQLQLQQQPQTQHELTTKDVIQSVQDAKQQILQPPPAAAIEAIPCPICNNTIEPNTNPCPHCNNELQWG